MGLKISVKHKIVVNGREYANPEDMPQDLRRAYEAALAKGGGNSIGMALGGRIRFNGREYAHAEEMPPEERRLYDLAMAAVTHESAMFAMSAMSAQTGEPPVPAESAARAASISAHTGAALAPGEQPRPSSGGVKWLLLLGLAIALFALARALGWSGPHS